MKNFSIFAAFKPRTILLIVEDAAFFVPQIQRCALYKIGHQSPMVAALQESVIVLGGTERDGLSLFIYFNFSFMPRTMKDASRVNNSSRTSTPTGAKSVSIEAFNIEMDAKNKAYHFIISHGLLDNYLAYSKNVTVSDPHAECINILHSQSMFKK